MYENLISAIAAARSRPLSFSIWQIICSRVSSSLLSSPSLSNIILSPSASLEEANLTETFCSSAWSSIRCIMLWRHLWTLPPWSTVLQKSCFAGFIPIAATYTACSTSSSMPSFFAAEIGTTGIPNIFSSLLTYTEPPFSLTSSIILSARTIGTSNSISCMVRYRFLSILVASTILIIPSISLLSRNSLVTISSLVYGDME